MKFLQKNQKPPGDDKRPSFAIPTIYVRYQILCSFGKIFLISFHFKAANKRFDEEAKGMYITWLPLPHPGALPGSTNGCLQFEVIKD